MKGKPTIKYLVTLTEDDKWDGFFIIRKQIGNTILAESLPDILFEIVAMGMFRPFDPDSDIDVKDFFELTLDNLKKYKVFTFQEAAFGFIARKLIAQKEEEENAV